MEGRRAMVGYIFSEWKASKYEVNPHKNYQQIVRLKFRQTQRPSDLVFTRNSVTQPYSRSLIHCSLRTESLSREMNRWDPKRQTYFQRSITVPYILQHLRRNIHQANLVVSNRPGSHIHSFSQANPRNALWLRKRPALLRKRTRSFIHSTTMISENAHANTTNISIVFCGVWFPLLSGTQNSNSDYQATVPTLLSIFAACRRSNFQQLLGGDATHHRE